MATMIIQLSILIAFKKKFRECGTQVWSLGILIDSLVAECNKIHKKYSGQYINMSELQSAPKVLVRPMLRI